MKLKISKKSPLVWLYGVGGVLLIAAASVWCVYSSLSPERVFWKTIGQSLATRAVSVQDEQSVNGTSAKQTIQYSLGASNLSHSITVLSQPGLTAHVETVSTPTLDYTRYLSIKTDQKKADGSKRDFSKAVGVWAKGQEGTAQFFAQAVFGTSLPVGGLGVAIGNLEPDSRNSLLDQIKSDHVYDINFSKTKKKWVNHRLQYTYEASVKPWAYIALMKRFGHDVGLHGLDQLDPQAYKERAAFTLLITVDAKAHQVVRIAVPDSGASQTYSAYDVPVQIAEPEHAITGAELQQRLSAAL